SRARLSESDSGTAARVIGCPPGVRSDSSLPTIHHQERKWESSVGSRTGPEGAAVLRRGGPLAEKKGRGGHRASTRRRSPPMFLSTRRRGPRGPPTTRRSVAVPIFPAMSAGGGTPPAAPQELALEVKMADEVDRVKAAEKKPEKPKAEPAPVRPPVVLKRWPL